MDGKLVRRQILPTTPTPTPPTTTLIPPVPSTTSPSTSSTSTTSTTDPTLPTIPTPTPPITPDPTTVSTTSTTSSTTTSTTDSSLPTTSSTTTISSTSSTPIPIPSSTPTTTTSQVTSFVPGTSTSSSPTNFDPASTNASDSQNNVATSKGFFHNTAAVAGVFTVAGLIVLILFVVLVTNAIRRRRAKKFDDEVASAAAAAYADADRHADWQEEDDRWNDGPSTRAYTSSSGEHTSGSYGAYNSPPLPIPLPGSRPQSNYANQQAYGRDEFPNRRSSQTYANIPPDPFGDGRERYPSTQPAPGIAGLGARQAEMRYRSPPLPVSRGGMNAGYDSMGPVNDGMQYDSGRYPVPPARSRSINNGNGNGLIGSRPPSMVSVGNSGSMIMSDSSRSPPPGRYNSPPTQQQRLAQMREHGDEDPYDGLTPESERSDLQLSRHGHDGDESGDVGLVEDAPRMLRVANV